MILRAIPAREAALFSRGIPVLSVQDGERSSLEEICSITSSDERAMDRYFFDFYNSEGPVLDEQGQLFETKERAKTEALRILHDVAHEEMPDRDLVKLTVKVRSHTGAQLFEASLILTSGWSA